MECNVWVSGTVEFSGIRAPYNDIGYADGGLAEHWDGVHSKNHPASWFYLPIVQDIGYGQVTTVSPTQTWFINYNKTGVAALSRWNGIQWSSETFPFGVDTLARVGRTKQLWLEGFSPNTGTVVLLGTCV